MVVELVSFTMIPVAVCDMAAAQCTGKKYTPAHKALKSAIESGHESVLEHASFTFWILGVSRVTLAQLTRHRLASYSVLSQRYVDMEGRNFVIPDSISSEPGLRLKFRQICEESKEFYKQAMDAGVPKEDARYIIPQGIETDLVMTMNARELRHFFALRCCNRARWEIRKLADEMFSICRNEAPELFTDCGPGCVTGQCKEAHPCGNPRSKDEW